MKGNEVFKVAVKTLEHLVDDVIEKTHLEKGQIDWLIPHQANIRIIEATAKRLQLPMERVILTVRDARQYVRRVRADGARYRDPRRPNQTRRPAAARSVRRRLHLGSEPRSLLMRTRRGNLPTNTHFMSRRSPYNAAHA